MKHKVKCELYIEFHGSKLPIAQVENLVYRWVFQNIAELDTEGDLVETWSATVETVETVVEDER
jgi:hypothetical protein